RVELFGQEINGESFGICKSDMLVTGHNPEQIAFGNTHGFALSPAPLEHCFLPANNVGLDK
ncbi:MAG: hypothetical protein WAW96_09495, partial [Alphaproteobacteria bacterium]